MSLSITDKLKSSVRRRFPRLVRLRNRIYNHIAHYRFRNRPINEVFTTIYNENHWNDAESKSGTGSNEQSTRRVAEIILKVVGEYQIKEMLDIPCGDFNWMKNVSVNLRYLGADIVEEIIDRNKKSFQTPGHEFATLDITTGPLPRVELILCRDCLVHFSYADIRKALTTVSNSGSNYFLTTTFPNHKNFDIITGNWRPINLQAPPFNFPEPLRLESEEFDESGYGEYSDKSLALWRIDELVVR